TSLPELITSIIAIRKGHSDIGIGNIIGSNIYNVLMIMGVGAALGGVLITSDVYVDYAIMIIFSLSLLIGLKTKIINRTMGIILATGYVLYLVTTFFK
ncbi:MAG: sodium:calcium antiporter, partial [Nitrosopumilus sp.]